MLTEKFLRLANITTASQIDAFIDCLEQLTPQGEFIVGVPHDTVSKEEKSFQPVLEAYGRIKNLKHPTTLMDAFKAVIRTALLAEDEIGTNGNGPDWLSAYSTEAAKMVWADVSVDYFDEVDPHVLKALGPHHPALQAPLKAFKDQVELYRSGIEPPEIS